MAKKRYIPKNFGQSTLVVIDLANKILEEYAEQGFTLTLRQLYYQFVARGYIPNKQEEYKRLGSIMGDARLAGMVDWDHMEDRTRNLMSLQHFSGPQDALNRLKEWYHVDMWERQKYRPVVFVEKDALTGVIQGVCQENDVPYFSCRGYTSLSEIYVASERFRRYLENGQTPYIIHFGDLDPSGVDMSRDITERLQDTFMTDCEFKRVALNMDQVEEYNPPPNPAKTSDSRYQAYVSRYGDESWELDALNPPVFRAIIEREIKAIRNQKVWDEDYTEKERVRKQLQEVSVEWESLAANKKELVKLRKDNQKAVSTAATLQENVALLESQIAELNKRKRKKDGE